MGGVAYARDTVNSVAYGLHQFMGTMGLTLAHPLYRWTYRAKLLSPISAKRRSSIVNTNGCCVGISIGHLSYKRALSFVNEACAILAFALLRFSWQRHALACVFFCLPAACRLPSRATLQNPKSRAC